MYIFRIIRTERGTKSDIPYQFYLQEHFFALFWFFFSDDEHVIQPFSFDFNFPARFQVHDALKGDFTARKASNERHSGRRSIFCGRSFTWTRETGPASEENRVLDRTYFGQYVPFSFPMRVRNNRVSLYIIFEMDDLVEITSDTRCKGWWDSLFWDFVGLEPSGT